MKRNFPIRATSKKRAFCGICFSWLAMAAVLLFSQAVSAQQVPIFSLYHENKYILNPGITGFEGVAVASLSYRYQWIKVDNAPQTLSAGYRMPVYSKGDLFQKAENFIGLGAFVMNDRTGPTSYLSGNITFAYHISFAKINPFFWAAFLRKSHLSFGLNFSVNQYRLDATKLVPDQTNDRLLVTADDSRILPNAGLGVYYYYDKFYFGFSSPQIIPWKVRYADDFAESAIGKVNHYFLAMGGKIPFGGRVAQTRTPFRGYIYKFYIEPVAWFKKVRAAPYQYDVYARFRYRDYGWVGAGYRSSKTMVFDAGFLVKKQLKFGYAYDMSISDISSYLGSTHEFIIAYQIDFAERRRR